MERASRVGKILVPVLVIWLLILDLVMLGVASGAFNMFYRGLLRRNDYNVALFALIEGTFLGAAVVCGLSHAYHYNSGSVGPAVATGVIAWAVDLLAVGIVCNEIAFGEQGFGEQGPMEKAIESFLIIILFFETVYIFILIGGLHCRRLGVGYSSAV